MTKGVIEIRQGYYEPFLIWVTCPHCGCEQEITDGDAGDWLVEQVENDNMDFSYTITCYGCEQEFTLTGLEC